MRHIVRLCTIVAGIACAGCTTGAVGGLPSSNAVPITSSGLQLAVGTATLTQANGSPFVALNVVTTFRQSNGQAATVSNTPTLSGPADFSAGTKTSSPHAIFGLTPQTITQATIEWNLAKQLGTFTEPLTDSFFASLVGAYGYGFAPDNIVGQTQNLTLFVGGPNPHGSCLGIVPIIEIPTFGTFAGSQPAFNAVRYIALDLPVFSNLCPNGTAGGGRQVQAYQYFGGPPAWPSPQGFGLPAGFPGYPLGFTDFLTAPVAGAYTLSLAIPTNPQATQYSTVQAKANLPASSVGRPLPQIGQPVLRIQPDGSAFIDVNVPSGVTEAIVLASTTRCDFGLQASQTLPDQHYGIVTHHTGFQSLFLSSDLGPPDAAGKPLHTFCTSADTAKYGTASASYSLTAVGFDYPAFEASYPHNTQMRPKIANAGGQADLTAANPVVGVTYPLQ